MRCSTGWHGAAAGPGLWWDLAAVGTSLLGRDTAVSAGAGTDYRYTARELTCFDTWGDWGQMVVFHNEVTACNSDVCMHTVT